MIKLPFTTNKILLIIAVILATVTIGTIIILSLNKTQQKEKSQQATPSAISQESNQDKISQDALPPQLKSLIDNSKSKPAGAKDSYYLLINNEMVIAYNQPENTFIVTANGKSNEEAAKTGYQAYLKGLGVNDLAKLNIIFRVRGEW